MSLGYYIEGIAVIEEHPVDLAQSETPSPQHIAAGNATLVNDKGTAAYGLRAVFDQPVLIMFMSGGFTLFEFEGDGSTVKFWGGNREAEEEFYFSWEPAGAQLLHYEWLTIPTG